MEKRRLANSIIFHDAEDEEKFLLAGDIEKIKAGTKDYAIMMFRGVPLYINPTMMPKGEAMMLDSEGVPTKRIKL